MGLAAEKGKYRSMAAGCKKQQTENQVGDTQVSGLGREEAE